jgi:hypothetical protein
MIMVRGLPDDPERKAVDYVRAAHTVGIDPALVRRWLNRGEVRALLYHENKLSRSCRLGMPLRCRSFETMHATKW